MITTIFLDLDDTLFSFQQAEQVALEETMRHYTLPYSDEILALYSAGNDAQWKLLEQDKVQRSEIGYRRFDLLLTHLGSAATSFSPEQKNCFPPSMGAIPCVWPPTAPAGYRKGG